MPAEFYTVKAKGLRLCRGAIGPGPLEAGPSPISGLRLFDPKL